MLIINSLLRFAIYSSILLYVAQQCRLPDYDYTAVGNSTSKKEAQSNAARDMVQYLVRLNQINALEVPIDNTAQNLVSVDCLSFLYILVHCLLLFTV